MEEFNQFINKYKWGPDYRTVRHWSVVYEIPELEVCKEFECGVAAKVQRPLKCEKFNDFQKDFVYLMCFLFYPNGNNIENNGYISLMFEEWEPFYENCSINFTLTLLDTDRNSRFPQSFSVDFAENVSSRLKSAEAKRTFGLSRYMKRNRLLSSDVFSSESLFVQCEIHYYPHENFFMPYSMYFNSLNEEEMLIVDDLNHPLWKILGEKSPYFKRVMVEVASRNASKNPRDHRRDLLDSCDFWSLGFCVKVLSDITSKDTPKIDLFDSKDFRSLSIMAKCILRNTDPSFNNIDEVFDLYKFADKVLVQEFKKKCSDYLKIHMTSDVVFDAIVMADMHSDDDLKKFALQYAVEHWHEAIESKSWTLLKDKDHSDSSVGNWIYFEMFHPKLAKEVMEYRERAEMSPKEGPDAQTETQRLEDFNFYH